MADTLLWPASPGTEAPSEASVGLLAANSRLDITAAQHVFRVLLETAAHPGRISRFRIAPTLPVPPVMLPALALADVDTGIAAIGRTSVDWGRVIAGATDARVVATVDAAIVVAPVGIEPAEVLTLRRGHALRPEDGARLCLSCDELDLDGFTGPDVVVLTLRGPGIDDQQLLSVRGLSARVIAALIEANSAFPAGIDTHLITAEGRVATLPRSTQISVLGYSRPRH